MVVKDKETHRYEREVVDGFRTLALKDPEMARAILSESQKALTEHDQKQTLTKKKVLPKEFAFSKGSTNDIMNLMSDVSDNSADSSVPRAAKHRTQSDDVSLSSDVASSLRSLQSYMDKKTHSNHNFLKKVPQNEKGKYQRPPLPKKTGFRPFSRFRKKGKPPLSESKQSKNGTSRQDSAGASKPKNVTVDSTKAKRVKDHAKVEVPHKEEPTKIDASKSDAPGKSFAGLFSDPYSSIESMMTGFFAEDNKTKNETRVDAEERDDIKDSAPHRSHRNYAEMPSLAERMDVSSESDVSSADVLQPSLSYSSDETGKSGGTFESNEDTLSDGDSVGPPSVRSIVLPDRAIRAPPCGLSPTRVGPPSVRSGSFHRRSCGSSVRSGRSSGTSRRAGPPSVRSGVGPALSSARSFRSVRSGLGSVSSRRTLSRKPSSIQKVKDDCDVSLDNGIGMKETFDDDLSGVFFSVPRAAPRDSFEMEMVNRGVDDDLCFWC